MTNGCRGFLGGRFDHSETRWHVFTGLPGTRTNICSPETAPGLPFAEAMSRSFSVGIPIGKLPGPPIEGVN